MVLAGAMAVASGALWWAAIRPHVAAPLVSGVNPFVVGALVALGELCTRRRLPASRDAYRVVAEHRARVRAVRAVTARAPGRLHRRRSSSDRGARDRLFGVKLVFNVALFMTEAAVAIAVFLLTAGSGTAYDPRTWPAAIAAAVVIDVLGGVLVTAAISLRQGHLEAEGMAWLAVAGAVSAAANVCFMVVAVILYNASPASVTLLGAIGAVMFVAYHAFVSLRQRHSELEVLREYTTALGGPPRSRTLRWRRIARPAIGSHAGRAEIWFLPSDE